MRYAQIKNGIVKNIITLNNSDLISNFSAGFDAFIDVRNIKVGINWIYDGTNFNEPENTVVYNNEGPLVD